MTGLIGGGEDDAASVVGRALDADLTVGLGKTEGAAGSGEGEVNGALPLSVTPVTVRPVDCQEGAAVGSVVVWIAQPLSIAAMDLPLAMV